MNQYVKYDQILQGKSVTGSGGEVEGERSGLGGPMEDQVRTWAGTGNETCNRIPRVRAWAEPGTEEYHTMEPGPGQVQEKTYI